MDWSSLIQRSEDALMKVEEAALPRVQRNLQQISDRIDTLGQRFRAGDEDSQAAALLLAREGIDPSALMQEIRGLPLAPPELLFRAAESSLPDFLRSVHETQVLGCLAEADADDVDRFDFAIDRTREIEWQKEKNAILPQLGRGLLSAKTLAEAREAATKGTDRARSRLNERAESYVKAVESLNEAVAAGKPFSALERFRDACPDPSPTDTSLATAKDVWTLLVTMTREAEGIDRGAEGGALFRAALLRGGRRYLESEHARYLDRVVEKFPSIARVGGRVQHAARVEGFLRVKLQERQGAALDIDGGGLDTAWMRIFYCLRSGFYREAADICLEPRVNDPATQRLILDWDRNGGFISAHLLQGAMEELAKTFGELQNARVQRPVHKAAVLVTLVGDRTYHEVLLRECPSLLPTMEDFLWFKLAVVRERDETGGLGGPPPPAASSLTKYSLADLQAYLNKFTRGHYTKEGREPLLYVSVLLLSLQLHAAVAHLCRDLDDPALLMDGLHLGLALHHDALITVAGNIPEIQGARPAPRVDLPLPEVIEDYGQNLQRACDSLERGVVLSLQYFSIVRRMVPEGEARDRVTKKLLTKLLRDTYSYSLLLGPGNGTAAAPAATAAALLSKLVPERAALRALLIGVATDMESNAEYNKALRIFLSEGVEERALALVNKELVRLLRDESRLLRSLHDFQCFVDLGRDCMDRLAQREGQYPIVQEAKETFLQLQRVRDAFVQDRKKQGKQVLQTLEDVGLIRGGLVDGDAPIFGYLLRNLPEVIVLAARNTFEEMQEAARAHDAPSESRLRAQLSSLLGAAARAGAQSLPREVLHQLGVLRLQAGIAVVGESISSAAYGPGAGLGGMGLGR